MSKSRSPFLSHCGGSQVSQSLAIREAIAKLSLSPSDTLKYLHGQPCLWSNTSDPSILVSLAALKNLYGQLKSEIYYGREDEEQIDARSLFRFLMQQEGESRKSVLAKWTKDASSQRTPPPAPANKSRSRATWKSLKVADRDSPRLLPPTPSVVPPLDPAELREACGWSEDSGSPSEEVVHEPAPQGLRILSHRELRPDESSSKSSSTVSSPTPASARSPREQLLHETDKSAKKMAKLIHKVDKAISPRIPSSNEQRASFRSNNSANEEKITSRFVGQASKGIQTEFELLPSRPKTADAEVQSSARSIDERNRDRSKSSTSSQTTTSLQRLFESNSGSTTVTTSSEVFSSGLSAGEIPIQKAAKWTSKSKCTVFSIRPDGSYASAATNFRAFKATVPPSTSAPTLMEGFDEYSVMDFMEPLMASTPLRAPQSSTIPKALKHVGFACTESSFENAGRSGIPVLVVGEHSVPTTAMEQPQPQVEELSQEEVRDFLVRKHLQSEHSAMRQTAATRFVASEEEEEEESTLNQISPMPSGE